MDSISTSYNILCAHSAVFRACCSVVLLRMCAAELEGLVKFYLHETKHLQQVVLAYAHFTDTVLNDIKTTKTLRHKARDTPWGSGVRV